MKKLLLLFFILLAVGFSFQACDDTKTYAEMLEEEDDAIADFINKEGIKVISQTEFFDNDSVTDVEKNEFVQLSSGVYMQIVDKGSRRQRIRQSGRHCKEQRFGIGTFYGIQPIGQRYDSE